jgi:hypothetical protein
MPLASHRAPSYDFRHTVAGTAPSAMLSIPVLAQFALGACSSAFPTRRHAAPNPNFPPFQTLNVWTCIFTCLECIDMASKVQGLYVLILDLIGPAASKSLANLLPSPTSPYHHRHRHRHRHRHHHRLYLNHFSSSLRHSLNSHLRRKDHEL